MGFVVIMLSDFYIVFWFLYNLFILKINEGIFRIFYLIFVNYVFFLKVYKFSYNVSF